MLYYEDFQSGQEFRLGEYTVSREEILDFARQYDPQPFHIDEEQARDSMFGGLIASGWHTASICMRLYVDAVLNGAASLGSPGVDELRWKRPVRPGDRLSGVFRILECRPFRKGVGLVRGRANLQNQDGKLVMTFVGEGMFATRPEL
ncbi:MAG: MaoC family dehydratase [Spirochaetales bacterium]|nr:MaoC family dehydratase [Leptospiraceae bacterium]MCP5480277.1 MaoC family dehydratase [Spirochaetales bacterium]MCP5486824.1 MaoC family dehydratase [Spirochaetales bacterium]